MTDEIPVPAPANPPAPEAAAPETAAPTPPETSPPPATQIPFNIGEEFGTSRKNLPPAKIVLIVVGAIALVAALVAFVLRPKPGASGSMDDVVSEEIPGQDAVMVAINLTIRNPGKSEYKIREIKADLDTNGNHYSDEPAAAVDFARYFKALPGLDQHAIAPLDPLKTIPAGGEEKGMIIVSFPVVGAAFNSRTSLKVTISAYGETVPLVLSK